MARRWKPERRNLTLECECGKPKTRAALACDRCLFLDGRGGERGEARVISTLRDYGPLSLGHLAFKANTGERNMHRLLMAMLQSGRISRYWEEADVEERMRRHFNGFGRWSLTVSPMLRSSHGGRWIYFLAASPERECQTEAVPSAHGPTRHVLSVRAPADAARDEYDDGGASTPRAA